MNWKLKTTSHLSECGGSNLRPLVTVSIHRNSAPVMGVLQFPQRGPQLRIGPQGHHVISHPGQLHYRCTRRGDTMILEWYCSYEEVMLDIVTIAAASESLFNVTYLICFQHLRSFSLNLCLAPRRRPCCPADAQGEKMNRPSKLQTDTLFFISCQFIDQRLLRQKKKRKKERKTRNYR